MAAEIRTTLLFMLFAVLVSLPAGRSRQPAHTNRRSQLTEQRADGALLRLQSHRGVLRQSIVANTRSAGRRAARQMIARLRQTAITMEADLSRPVKPALDLITPLAQPSAGEDGLYRARMSPAMIDEVAGWAANNDLLLIL